MKCPTCPISGWCRGEIHAAVCDRRNPSHPAYNPSYANPLPGEEGHGAPPPTRTPEQDAVVAPSIFLAVINCEYRTQEPNCGCAGKWRCGRDEKDVTFQECVDCKQGQPGT